VHFGESKKILDMQLSKILLLVTLALCASHAHAAAPAVSPAGAVGAAADLWNDAKAPQRDTLGGTSGSTSPAGSAAKKRAAALMHDRVAAQDNCDKNIKQELSANNQQNEANVEKGLKQTYEAAASCLSKYGKFGAQTKLRMPDFSQILDQVEQEACRMVDDQMAAKTAPLSKDVGYNNGVVNVGGQVNPVVFGGGSSTETTGTNVNVQGAMQNAIQ
jgi:hypothetical protein